MSMTFLLQHSLASFGVCVACMGAGGNSATLLIHLTMGPSDSL